MFSSLKSFSSNINFNYSVSPTVSSTAGLWKIYDAKKKSTQKAYSVFVLDRKALDSNANSLDRSGAAEFKRVTLEAVELLKKEASSLARLRHPNILELVEPVEETRGGGLQFVTEPVTTSLASLLQDKDEQERTGGIGGRSSRYVTEDSDGSRRRRELEIDELEIQKGLLQVAKALEFLHENAGLVHCNLTPEAILINAKSDWKISGLAFCSPPSNSSKPTSVQPIDLTKALKNLSNRIPQHAQIHYAQINLDYASPDLVLDNNLTTSTDMFSLGLLCVALYNSPHRSPIETRGDLYAYKRMFNTSSTIPCAENDFLSKRPLPKDLTNHVLPRLITRRPAQRWTALEFQDSQYFDNILVSTIRFLDAFPAKTPGEKLSFLRGLNKVLPSFPKSVMEKKILPALLEELKDKELLSLILQNVFKILSLLSSSRRAFGERVRPRLREIFIDNAKQSQEKDTARDAGLMVVLENTKLMAENSSGKEFKDDILPVVLQAVESSTPSLVDAALRGLPVMLPILDFSTIKNELFPVIAAVFSKTNSLAIKVRGCRAFVILCGGSSEASAADDGLDGLVPDKKKKTSFSSALDKYTMQERIVPLIKAIKTKEPAVMMAALDVLRVVGETADADFVAMEMLPILWNMSLGPLLDLKQFQGFMVLIRSLSRRVEDEQTRKLQELAITNGVPAASPNDDFLGFGGVTGTAFDATNTSSPDDFERLVKGKISQVQSSSRASSWDAVSNPGVTTSATKPPPAQFSWSTPTPASSSPFNPPNTQSLFRTVTPDLSAFSALSPQNTQYSQPLQPNTNTVQTTHAVQPATSGINWPSTTGMSHAPLPMNTMTSSMSSMNMGMNMNMNQPRPPMNQPSSFSLAPPPSSGSNTASAFRLPPPPSGGVQGQASSMSFGQVSSSSFGVVSPPTGSMNSMMNPGMGNGNRSMNSMMGSGMNVMKPLQTVSKIPQQQQQNLASGLDKYESLL
ncbi:kinase-like domain-containing protein [Xylaria nigripes]|nr:kinase-like domain-containing protein [Xylaria nigripes]